MIIIIGLALLVPALIGLLCYEKFKGIHLAVKERVEYYLIFAFLVNLAGHAVLWLRGWDKIEWSLGSNSSARITGVVAQYMIIALIAAIVIAYVLSLTRIGKSAVNPDSDDTEQSSGSDSDNDSE